MKLGDKISELTEALGVKPCEGCKKRALILNNLFDKSPMVNRSFSNGARHVKLVKDGDQFVITETTLEKPKIYIFKDLDKAKTFFNSLCH